MPVHYEVRIFNSSGVKQAVIDAEVGFRRLGFSHLLNERSNYTIELDGESPFAQYLTTDAIVEIWRRYVPVDDRYPGIPWYKEFEGVHRTPVRQYTQADIFVLNSYGFSYDDLLRRRIVAYRAGHPRAAVSGVADVVMKDLVRYNCGSSATVGNGRLRDGVMPGLTVEADETVGPTWQAGVAYKNIMDTLRDIAKDTGVDFRVVGTGSGTVQFRTYYPQLGTDRSELGLDPVTGLNAAGQIPVVLSLDRGNMLGPTHSYNRSDEFTVVVAGGQGEEELRQVEVRENTAFSDDSPWNDIEEFYQASSADTLALLQASADTRLAEGLPVTKFSFEVAQVPGMVYGRDYFFGDVLTAKFANLVSVRLKLVGLSATYDNGKEELSHTFEEA